MLIPDSFKNSIKNKFYDKEIFVLSSKIVCDDEGGKRKVPIEISSSFKGNVNFSNFGEIKESFGLDYNIAITITTDYENIDIDSVIRYRNINYKIKDFIPFDSHYLIIGVLWK